ncbi:MAG: hypothetical protein CMJ18_06445 [Phycisphaeraceae bacterium]|nr:hypothetical protein [Phycisphaeraceae bacterium]
MKPGIRRARTFIAWVGLSIAALGPAVVRGEEAPQHEPATTPGSSVREQSIYIPYRKLREVFEKEQRGVFLPYERFIELWRAARDQAGPVPPAGPPVSDLITEMHSEVTVSEDVVRVVAKIRIEVLRQGWVTVPLRLPGVGDRAGLDQRRAGAPLSPGRSRIPVALGEPGARAAEN